MLPYLRSAAGLILQSVASSTGAAAESARSGFGFTMAEPPSELMANPNVDAVFILTRHNSHAAYVAKVKAQADALVAARYMLPTDAARIVAEAEAAKVP